MWPWTWKTITCKVLIRVGNCELVSWGESQIQFLQQIPAERRSPRLRYGSGIQDWNSFIPCTFLVLWAMLSLLYSNIPNAVSATSSEQTWTYTEEEWGRLGQGIAKCSKYIQMEQTSESRVHAKQRNLAGNFFSLYVQVCYRGLFTEVYGLHAVLAYVALTHC